MKIGVVAGLLSDLPLKDALKYFRSIGIEQAEIGCGGFPGDSHCKPAELLENPEKLRAFEQTVADSGLTVSALSCHGNPVHPDKKQAKMYDTVFRDTVLLAEKLGITRIITFSGCPGGSPDDKTPNWVTCPWPNDFSNILRYQWNDVLIPYWKEAVKFASSHGIKQIALEMHPGFCVYNPETMLKLRDAVGSDVLGANFDPSHLFWQGIEPVAAIRELGDAIQYVHAKDTRIDAINTAKHGVLDTKKYTEESKRSWIFRTVGYGHDAQVWKDIVSNLKLVGYNDVLSIEHEDSLMAPTEGLEKAVKFLKEIVFVKEPAEAWWV